MDFTYSGEPFLGPITKEESEASLITGVVVDRQGHSIRGAKVELINPQNKALLATTTTDRSGFYSFLKTLEEAWYQVEVTHGSVVRVQMVRAGKSQLSQLDFEL
jgi:hypothetical protein